MTVPIALRAQGTPVPQLPERLCDLLLDQFLERLPHPIAHLLQRIEPVAADKRIG